MTGAEALYADMGHFGRGPIRAAWTSLVFPALALNSSRPGQFSSCRSGGGGGLLLPAHPAWALLPLVLLATVATVIASQAVITGAFFD